MFRLKCFLPITLMKLNKIKIGKKIRLIGWPVIYAFKGSSIELGENVTVNSNFLSNLIGLYQRTIIVARNGGKIKIGNNVGISGATLYARESISIGDNTLIGANTKVFDNDFHPLDAMARNNNEFDKLELKPVVIGENVFVGCNVIITKGTIIGDNCIVGAGSVVHGEFPDNCVIAGNPAGIIRKNN